MRRLLLSLALIGASVALGASVAFATNPTVSLAWSAAGVNPGDNAVLEIRVVGEVTGLYGSTIDVYYDAESLTPVLSGATTAAGLLDLPGTDPPQSFSAVSSSAPDAPPRVSLISLRVGDNPGVTDPALNGLLGRVEFQVNALASGGSTISFSAVDSNGKSVV